MVKYGIFLSLLFISSQCFAITLTKTTSGLLYKSDNSTAGWTTDSKWSTANDPQFVCWALGRDLYQRTPDGNDSEGVREPQLFIENGLWWMLNDAGDRVHGWLERLSYSVDRGLTWNKLGEVTERYNKAVSGTWFSSATGWLEKRGSTYYRQRLISTTDFGQPYPGLSGNPYYWDTWQTNSLFSPWTASAQVPADTQYYHFTAPVTQWMPGSVVYTGGSYYAFGEVLNSGTFYNGVGTNPGSDPGGPWVYTYFMSDNATTGYNGRAPENPKVFWSSTLNRWVCMTNLIDSVGYFTSANALGYSTSVTDWSAAKWRIAQLYTSALDSTGGAIGVAVHATGPDGLLIEDSEGNVPFVFDSNPQYRDHGWHAGRSIRQGVMEPSTTTISAAGASDSNVYRIERAQSFTDGVIEYAFIPTAGFNTDSMLRFEYRMDTGGSNGYRVFFSSKGAGYEKIVSGGVSVQIQPSVTIVPELYATYRIKIVATGNRHQIYTDGTLQIDTTDNSSPITTGGYIGLATKGWTVGVRGLTIRSSDVVTIAGMTPGTSAWMRAVGGLPAGSVLSNATGTATYSQYHYPLSIVDLNGTDYTPSGGIWGGDTLTFSGLPAAGLAAGVQLRSIR